MTPIEFSNLSPEPRDETASAPRRFFLHEPGWSIRLKVGSEREFCYMMNPGQDYYHRISDGELYVSSPEERLCFACAQRRGILTHEPKGLRQPIATFILASQPGYDLLEVEEFQSFE